VLQALPEVFLASISVLQLTPQEVVVLDSLVDLKPAAVSVYCAKPT
jgi:hypothetical protein